MPGNNKSKNYCIAVTTSSFLLPRIAKGNKRENGTTCFWDLKFSAVSASNSNCLRSASLAIVQCGRHDQEIGAMAAGVVRKGHSRLWRAEALVERWRSAKSPGGRLIRAVGALT